jgi:hypothetical protein
MTILLLPIFILVLFLYLDYIRVRIIKFRPDGDLYWQVALSEQELFDKLEGRLADVIMPEKPFIVRIYRKFFLKSSPREEINVRSE